MLNVEWGTLVIFPLFVIRHIIYFHLTFVTFAVQVRALKCKKKLNSLYLILFNAVMHDIFYLVPVSVSSASGQGLLDPSFNRPASAAPASLDLEKSHRCSGPLWPAMLHSASANWNCRMVRVKYLPRRRRILWNSCTDAISKGRNISLIPHYFFSQKTKSL